MKNKTNLKRHKLHQQNGRCFYCFDQLLLKNATFDHFVPDVKVRSMKKDKRPTFRENTVVSCSSCNQLKGKKTAEDLIDILARETFLEIPKHILEAV